MPRIWLSTGLSGSPKLIVAWKNFTSIERLLNGFIAIVFLLASMSVSATCSFVVSKESAINFSYRVSGENCKHIKLVDERLVTLRVSYPTMEILDWDDRSKNLIVLILSPVSASDLITHQRSSKLKINKSNDGVELLEGSRRIFRLADRDGNNTYISEWEKIYSGKRIYKSKWVVDYLFRRELSDLKKVDESVMYFLDNILID